MTRLNFARSLANLPAVTEDFTDANFDPGCQLHAEWIVLNNQLSDSETPDTPGYTADGAAAAVQSNSESSTAATLTITQAVDGLMVAPFHGVGFIDPLLTTTGFGLYADPSLSASVIRSAAVINVLGGRTGLAPAASAYPILWPAQGQTSPYASYSGNEFPDPTTSLSFITQPSAGVGPGVLSAPIIAQFASTPSITDFSVSREGSGTQERVGEIDETNYVNPTASTQSAGRDILGARHAVVLMTSTPFQAGATYQVSITNAGLITAWSFSLTSNAQHLELEGSHHFR